MGSWLTRRSQINQQIALKSIKKFGFSVNAVWNGQEALDYLLEKPTPSHPRPDIILMDVQMPILDGYRATHRIRTQEPFKSSNIIRRIPIVAMTASAIQGDREKCQRAGMDDYLAKPVKPKLLEKMLVKWGIETRRKQERAKEHGSSLDSEDSRLVALSTPTDQSEGAPEEKIDNHKPKRNAEALTRHLSDKLNSIDFANRSIMQQSRESENDREARRAEAEEKASSLRDDKLLAATDNPRKHQHFFSEEEKAEQRGISKSHALTKENIERFEQQQDDPRASREEQRDNDSNVRSRSTEAANIPSDRERPSLRVTRQYESERTLLGRSRRRGG